MSDGYYQHVRAEVAPLLPPNPQRILEVGCGSGGTLAWLREKFPSAHTTGLEGFAENEPKISACADRAIIADLDQPLPDLGQFDLILALDVLEHLKRPEETLEAITKHLTPDGVMVVSLPSVSHISVSAPLLFKRKFNYTDAGILDRTHLRLFVEETAVGLMNSAGLTVTAGVVNGLEGQMTKLLDITTFGLVRHWFTKQYIMRAEFAANGVRQSSVAWEPSYRQDW